MFYIFVLGKHKINKHKEKLSLIIARTKIMVTVCIQVDTSD